MSLFAEYDAKPPTQSRLDASCGLVIRLAAESDLRAIAAITAEREGDSLERRLRSAAEFLRQCRATGRSSLLVAQLRDQVIGFGECSYFVPPEDAPRPVAPEGWYLAGLIIAPKFRRRHVGLQLTHVRLQWIAQRADCAYYFANAKNLVSIELHQKLGFVELTRKFFYPGATFAGGEGILFRTKLT
jgi:ribosomal protein S18 acetylase RimI-like enzyme